MKPAKRRAGFANLPQPRTSPFGRPFGNQWLTLTAALSLALGATQAIGANVLYNGDMDIISSFDGQNNPGPDGWYITAVKTLSGPNYDGADSETWCNVQQTGGYGVFFKPFQGSTNGGLNDYITVDLYQDNPATPTTQFTLSGYAAGEANFCGFIPGPTKALFVVEFLDSTGTVLSSNALDLVAAGLPNSGAGSMMQFTTPQYTAPANTATVRAGAFLIDAYSTTGAQSFFVDAFDLEATAPAGSPVITNQPSQTTVSPGTVATLSVGVSNPSGVNYQWQFYNTNIVNVPGHISGANQATLTITGASAADVGHYRVLVSNNSGSVYSQDGTLALVGFSFDPVIAVTGKLGDSYRVDYSTALDPTTWITLTTVKLTTSPQYVIDTGSAGYNTRFYRAVYVH